jgi:hypothetical protein
MGEVVNLNRARKAKRRDDDRAKAAANRAAFGRTKAEKLAAQADAERQLDGAKREE